MVREHGSRTEELWMLDYRNVLEISLLGTQQPTIGLELRGENVKPIGQKGHILIFKAVAEGWVIAVGSRRLQPLTLEGHIMAADAKEGGFCIAAGRTAEEAVALLQDTRGRPIASRWSESSEWNICFAQIRIWKPQMIHWSWLCAG